MAAISAERLFGGGDDRLFIEAGFGLHHTHGHLQRLKSFGSELADVYMCLIPDRVMEMLRADKIVANDYLVTLPR